MATVVTDRGAEVRERIRSRRLRLGLTQEKAAKLAGVSLTTWSTAETRRLDMRGLTLAGICRALGWRPDTIDRWLDGDDDFDEVEEPSMVAHTAEGRTEFYGDPTDPRALANMASTLHDTSLAQQVAALRSEVAVLHELVMRMLEREGGSSADG